MNPRPPARKSGTLPTELTGRRLPTYLISQRDYTKHIVILEKLVQHFVANMSREEKFDTYLLKTTETRRNFQIDLFQLLEEGQRQLAKDEQAEQDEGNFPTILYEKQHRSFT